MTDEVPLSQSLRALLHSEAEVAYDQMLLQEGLDLLAFYKAIGDKDVRMAIKALVERLAAVSLAGQR